MAAEARADPWFFLGCLNENLPDFVDVDAIEDYARCANALSGTCCELLDSAFSFFPQQQKESFQKSTSISTPLFLVF